MFTGRLQVIGLIHKLEYLKLIIPALNDIRETAQRHHLWRAMAWEDITDQHQRTTLGPIWLLVNYLIFAGAFVVVFGHNQTGDINFAAYVSIGLFVWMYIAEVLSQGVSLFIREENYIKGTRLPLPIYVMRATMQLLIRQTFTFVGCLIILFLTGISWPVTAPLALFGMAIIIASTPPLIFLIAAFGAYFPDSQFIVQNLVRLGMFLTPIFWFAQGGSSIRQILAQINPFTHVIALVRDPVVMGVFPLKDAFIALVFIVCFWLAAIYLLALIRKKIIFWL